MNRGTFDLLMESGSYLLLETGTDKIILEEAPPPITFNNYLAPKIANNTSISVGERIF